MKSQKFSIFGNSGLLTKAQLTPFIILGLVILSVFGFVFFATGTVQREQAEQQAQQIFTDLLESTSLRFYVTQCTENALEKGLDIISKQGGKIFPNQLGSIMNENEKVYLSKEDDTTYFIAYGILGGGVTLPQWPCKPGYDNFASAPAYCAYRSNNPKFNNLDIGIANLPVLCKDKFGGCSAAEGWSQRFSLQAELESYVSAYVKNCVNFESVIGVNQTYNVSEGNVSSNITFSDNSITAVINFPIILSPMANQKVTKFVSFETTIATRFKLLYGLARDAVVMDVNSKTASSFDIVNGFLELAKNKLKTDIASETGFIIEKTKNVAVYDDLVKITDTASDPENPLVLQFLIENRPPVLEYLAPTTGVPGPFGKDVSAGGCGAYDIKVLEGVPLTIVPKKFDTEEDAIKISYSGWLWDYNETHLFSNEYGAAGCPILASQIKYYAPALISDQRRWKVNSDQSITAEEITEEDVGFHNIVISACDEQYCDNQTIRILVDDVMKVTVTSANEKLPSPYSQIFSLEDPFSFKAEVKDIYDPGVYTFEWQRNPPFSTSIFTAEQTLPLPSSQPDITTITQDYQNMGFVKNNLYTVTARVIQSGIFVDDDTDVTPVACIGYVSANPVFPYNTTDPFASDHACCVPFDEIAKNTLKTSSANCFSKTSYGSFKSFNLAKYVTPYDGTKITRNTEVITQALDLASNLANNIFRRSFERKCDGERGNACLGLGTETFTSFAECQDKQVNEIARCFGPPEYLLSANTESFSETSPSCVIYNQKTFEFLTGTRTDIKCSQAPKCTSFNNAADGFVNTGANKRYFCDATCGKSGVLEGCIQTLNSLCQDCYQEQSCSGPIASTPKQRNSFAVKAFDVCNDASGCNTVSVSPSPEDYCQADGRLVDYRCLSPPFTTIAPYVFDTIDCAQRYEKAADETDDGINLNQIGICTDYFASSCINGACTDETGSTQNQDDVIYTASASAYLFYEYYASDSDADNIKEDCAFQTYDLDNYENLCQIANILEESGRNFVWKNELSGQNKCCGDDAAETGC